MPRALFPLLAHHIIMSPTQNTVLHLYYPWLGIKDAMAYLVKALNDPCAIAPFATQPLYPPIARNEHFCRW